MNANTQQSKWYVDMALFTAFIAAFFLHLTGLALHQWLGMGVLAVSLYHLVTHWKWVKSVTRQFFSASALRPKFYYAIDAGILLGLLTIIGTGIVISSWLNLTTLAYPAWKSIHVAASAATLVLTVAKIGLHWRWIVSTARKALSFTPGVKTPALAAQPAAAARRVSRREFVGLMGITGAASVAALSNTFNGLPSTQPTSASAVSEATTNTTPVPSTSSTATTLLPVTSPTLAAPAAASTAVTVPTATSVAQSSVACVISCNRNCSFPGRCRRYVDSNGNNRCDNSECAA